MESNHICRNCKQKNIIRDDDSLICQSCGLVQSDDGNFQHDLVGINAPQGTNYSPGSSTPSNDVNGEDFSYEENKIYHARKEIEDITEKLKVGSEDAEEVKRMIEEITEGEYGIGDWFSILIGACSYIVRRKEKVPLAMEEVASVISCDFHELGRMVVRVVDFLNLDFPEFDIVESFDCLFI